MSSAAALLWSLVATRLGLWIRVFALMICCRILCTAALDDYEGKIVNAIEFQPAAQPLSYGTLTSIIPLKAGIALRGSVLRASIQRLYSTGEYQDIAVDASPEATGVRIRFITTPNFFVGYLDVGGVPEPPSEGQLATAAKITLGDQFNDNDINEAEEGINDLLRRNGFYKTSISPRIVRDAATQEVKIFFTISPGPRARFNGIEVTGNPERSTPSLLYSTGWKPLHGLLPWRSVSDARVQSGLESIRSWYFKHNHLLAHVTLTSLNYQEEANRIAPRIDIQSGPLVRVKVSGASISGGQLRSILPIFQEREIDKDLLDEGRKSLASYFQSKGYYDSKAEVDTSTQPNGDETIRYEVDLGRRHKLVKLEIHGNRYFTTGTLRERMDITPASFPRFQWGRFSHADLDHDIEAIRILYRSNGFADVAVTAKEADDYRGPNTLGVFIEIHEGFQQFVSRLDILGVTDTDRKNLLAILHSTVGQPYSEFNVASDRDASLDYFYNNGHPHARFEFTVKPASTPNHFDLQYQITPGQQEFVRNVIVNGLRRTDSRLVDERISIESGDPLSQSKITGSQQRLNDLGVFSRVNTAIQNPEGDEPSKYVIFSTEEAHLYSVNVGFGAQVGRIGGGITTLDSPAGVTGFSPQLSVGLTRLNLFGEAQTANLQTLLSTLEQRALLTYTFPQLLGDQKLSLQVTGLFDISNNVRTFSARREEGSIQLSRRVHKDLSFQVRYAFRKVNVLGTPLVTPELIPLYSQPVRVGLIGFSFVQDRRDDPTDAHHGVYNTVDLAFANSGLGSQTGFGRIIARNATYHQLTRNLTLARSTYFGTINRYAGLAEIPLAERFFSGGSSSQRAFPDNQAGPRDLETGFPIGGNALFMNSVELRFPLVGENVGGVLFNDMGNVYSSLSDISLRWRQRNLSDFNYGVQGFGFGIRYKTPIGPVRLDLSLSPNSPRFFGFSGTYEQLIFGGGKQVVQRINVFQFHFSLGQAF